MHITRLQYAPARNLLHAAHDSTVVVLMEPVPWKDIPLISLAQVEQNDTVENNLRTTEVRLTATIRCPGSAPNPAGGPYAYLLTEADGTRWLLGTNERPFTQTMLSLTRAAQPGDQSAEKLSVQLKCRHGLLKIK